MKVQLRQGVFETNSSSTHSLSICTAQEWQDLKNGKALIRREDVDVLPYDEAIEFNKNYAKSHKLKWDYVTNTIVDGDCDCDYECYTTWDEFYNNTDYEFFTQHFTTPSGDQMVAWGYYGYDY